MKCPEDKADLTEQELKGVTVDTCDVVGTLAEGADAVGSVIGGVFDLLGSIFD